MVSVYCTIVHSGWGIHTRLRHLLTMFKRAPARSPSRYYPNILACPEELNSKTDLHSGDCVLADGKFMRMHSSRLRFIRMDPRTRTSEKGSRCGKGSFFDARGWECYPLWNDPPQPLQQQKPINLTHTKMMLDWSSGNFTTFNGVDSLDLKRRSYSDIVYSFAGRIGYYNESGYVTFY